MQKKLFATYFVVILIAIAASLFAFWGQGYQFIKKQNDVAFLTRAVILTDELKENNLNSLSEIQEFTQQKAEKFNVRLTIIGMDGTVLADSMENPKKMDNHHNRIEVKEAIEGGEGSAMRYSTTMGVDYHYAAVYFDNPIMEGILRVSTPLSAYQKFGMDLVNSMLVLIAVGMVIALLLAAFFSKKITRPIQEISVAAENISAGDYDARIYTQETDQIGRLAKAFNKMSKNLSITMDILTSRNSELEAILSSMSSGVIAVDRANNIMFYNQSFLNIVHAPYDDIENEPLYNVIRNVTMMDVIDAVKEKETRVIEEGTLLHDKLEQNIRVTGVLLRKENKKQMGTLLVIEDITQIKRLENVRQEFVSNVTHELKTPLTSIRGFVDTLKNGAMNDPVYANRFLDIIDIEAERLHSLIQDILVLSEIESGQDDERSMCRIPALVDDVVELLEGKRKPNVELKLRMEENLPDYFCNPFRMKEVFMNLIDNAIKYTEEGSIEVLCKTEEEQLLIEVRDTGIGIATDHLPRLFERFYRVDKGRSRKQGGTGLGLSIVKHIVELYNGTIVVKSEPNEGTIFSIRMPY